MLLPTITAYFDSLDIGTIPEARRNVLDKVRDYILEKSEQSAPVNLTFICTHNSRRSILGQVWAQVASAKYGFPNLRAFSGGTETTACNPRTVATLLRAGLEVNKTIGSENPVYEIRYSEVLPPVVAFSKVYDENPNPTHNFAAIMTCGHADENCPFIPGAEKRFAVTYTDPKEADDTPAEASTYDARCRQIATEMKYLFAKV